MSFAYSDDYHRTTAAIHQREIDNEAAEELAIENRQEELYENLEVFEEQMCNYEIHFMISQQLQRALRNIDAANGRSSKQQIYIDAVLDAVTQMKNRLDEHCAERVKAEAEQNDDY